MFSTSNSYDAVREGRTHKDYECDVCKNRFSTSNKLARHNRTHTGEKSSECDVCNKKFSQSNDLLKHKRTHNGDKTL